MDKFWHFIVSAILTFILSVFLGIKMAIIIVLCLGICKELYDWIIEKESFCLGDLCFDIIGIITGGVLSCLILQ